ncbi:MAG: 6,7-dimethyl-8-ribityllumazine synthase [Candidatus Omnitrophica bacterium]|nr:6,7-dimethyl-8-ribityllumazine synthase [Candidatus Omnitrophota bacterium]
MVLNGKIHHPQGRFGIVAARFNEFITRRLVEGALSVFEQAGIQSSRIDIVWVPGALEVAYACKRLASSKKPKALVAAACVLRGDTYHFECVSNEVTRGIAQVSLMTDVPIASAVITADSLDQAIDRAGLKAGNKGAHAAYAALELAGIAQVFSKVSV